MEIEEIGTIGYGSLTFVFEMSESVRDFLVERNIDFTNLLLHSQVFYQSVLIKLGISHKEEIKLKAIFNGIRFESEIIKDTLDLEGENFENFPHYIDDLIYFLDFILKI